MPLSKNLRRERSLAIDLKTVTFNAPGIYYPPYGKSVFELSGRGTPGNATVPGNDTGTTNSTAYNYYRPASGGNVANTNPGTGGNYAGEAPAPGNVIGYNPAIPAFDNGYQPGNYNGVLSYVNPPEGNQNPGQTVRMEVYNEYTLPGGAYVTFASEGGQPAPYSTQFYWVTYGWAGYATFPYFPGNYNGPPGYPNPATPGNTNPGTPGFLNAYDPGSANYNPPGPAAPYYNPYTPGNSNYNPYVAAGPAIGYNPGNPIYNPDVLGTSGTNYAVLGIPLPGGAIASPAPVIGYTTIQTEYTTIGVPISVPPGGYVIIRNKQPGT